MLRRIRRFVEYLSLAIIILIPFVSYLNYLRQAYGKNGFHFAEVSGGWFVGKLFALYELTLGRLEDPVSLIDSIKGTFWSITLFGLKISDPLAGIGHILTSKVFYVPLLLSLLIPLLLTILFGRAYCGWMCPINTLMEGVDRIRTGLAGRVKWIRDVKMDHSIKYWILVATILLMAVTGIPLFAYYLPYLILGREVYHILFFKALSAGAILLVLLLLFELFISRRGWCRYLCPSGAFLSLVGDFSFIKVRHKGGTCPDLCFECDRVCPMGLEVREGRHERECTNCGECVIVCPQGVLGFDMRIKKGVAIPILIILLITVFSLVPSRAHHVAGLPHYGYAENYPQVPTNEQTKEVDNYVVSLTTIFFQGIKQELSNIPYDTQFYIHVYDKSIDPTHSPKDAVFVNPFDPEAKKKKEEKKDGIDPSYRDKLLLTILDKEGRKIATYSLDFPYEEAIYRFRHYFKRPGEYLLKVSFYPDGKEKVVTFPVSIEISKKGSYLTTVILLIFVLGVGAYVFYRKRSVQAPPAG